MKLMYKVGQLSKLAKTMKGAWLLLFLLGLQGFAWGQVVLDTINPGCAATDGSIKITITGSTSTNTFEIYDGSTLVANYTGTTNPSIFNGLDAKKYLVKVYDNSSTIIANEYVSLKRLDFTNISQTLVTCFGGSDGTLTIKGIGGTITPVTNDYLYTISSGAWQSSGTFSGLAQGTYSFSVKDNTGCIISQNITINQNSVISSFVQTNTPVKCKGGSDGLLKIIASGGVASYQFKDGISGTYQASNTLSGLSSGNHTVYIKDSKGCEVNSSVTITEPAAALSEILSTTNITCNTLTDGKASLSVSGGTAGYTYLWTGTGSVSSFTSTSASLTGLAAGTYNYVVTDANSCQKSGSATIVEPAAISISSSKTDVSCKGGSTGSITLTVSGGTVGSGYSYSWTGPSFSATTKDISTLIAGSYTVTVTDANGCTNQSTIVISEPAAILDATASTTNAKCKNSADGSITLTPSGGTSTYTYLWNNSSTNQNQTNLVAGTYSVTITDSKGCTANKSYVITEPTAISVVLSTTNISCNGLKDGKTSLVVSGGTASYTYAWTGTGSVSWRSGTNDTMINLPAGTYNYVVTDANSCQKSGSATIQDPDTIAISNVNTNVSCNGGNDGDIKLTLLGGSPISSPIYNYSWTGPGTYSSTSKNISGLTAGTYVITVTDNNSCTKNKTIKITEPSAIWIADSTINVTCNGLLDGQIFLKDSGGTGTHTYSWVGPGTFTATTKNISGLIAGDYTVTVKDNLNCTKTLKVTVTEPIKIALSATVTDLKCNSDKSGAITLTIIGGTPAYNYDWTGPGTYKNTVDKDLSGIGAGSYKLILTDNNGCSDSITKVVAQPTKMVLIYDSSNVLCNGSNEGFIDITVSGGTVTGSYIYNWDGPNSFNKSTEDITKLKAGDYIYTVLDDNNCQLLDTITIFEPAKLQLNIATVSVCNGFGTLTFNAYGGVKPYIYFVDGNLSTSPVTNLPDKIYTVLTQDSNFCLDSVKVNLIHNDGILPTVNVNNITVYLDNSGSATIKTSDIDNGSFDNCGVDTMYLNKYTFNCSEVGIDTVILSVKDINGNIRTKKALVTVLDTISPVITVQNTIISIDTSSKAYLKQAMVVLTSSDNCSVDTIVLSKNVFTLADVGVNSVSITITDKSGNTVVKTVNVTVIIGDNDNDSIPDYLEKNYDTDKDGIMDYADVDSDNDGILDVVENEGLKTLVDFDGDSHSNYVDLDSDNDGINDVIEADVTDANNDGIKDDLTVFVSNPNNQDGTGKADYLDLDADDDGMFDAYESKQNYTDSNNDGIIDGVDLDGDGIVEFADGSGVWGDAFDVKPVDSDSDATGDWRDIDSDGDKIPDAVELMADTDGDGISNYLDLDSDGDKIPDAVEAGATPNTPVDTDSDGKADYIDLDSDGDKIPDSLEAGATPNTPVDTDGDGKADYIDLDSDGDTIPDAVEAGSNGNSPTDTDGDGIYDFREIDSDGDGINDSIEAGSNPASPVDTDGDGAPDYQDLDSDGDTIPDSVEGNIDTDGDGKANYIDTDSDNDELLDINELTPKYIIAEVTIPEGFSPNGDADNDVLYIQGLKVFTSAEITVFNRNGQVVYESGQGYKNNWDGTNKGSNPSFGTSQLPEGIYFYVFKFNGQNRQPISGNIYIKP